MTRHYMTCIGSNLGPFVMTVELDISDPRVNIDVSRNAWTTHAIKILESISVQSSYRCFG